MTVSAKANKVKEHLVSHSFVFQVMNLSGIVLSAAFANALTPEQYALPNFQPLPRSKVLLIPLLPFLILFFALCAIL